MEQLQDPIQFGEKYLLVEHIATGGMAEIYRAQYTGIEGFAKDLVVKRLRPEYAKRPEVVEMFLNEAKVAATLTHNNIIHTYDLGEIDGEYFIAMELLRGEELVAVLRQSVAQQQLLPQGLAIGIVQQVLEGLQYAHTREQDGDELGLVHRDINPTNIYVGYDGVCKIVDFGIVLTQANRKRGTGKFAGKMSYMAPEQMRGEELDGRSDIFPVGVMLYEMTVGQRLFRGSPEEVRRRVLEGDIPAPTMVVPEFPPALESIILQALEVDPARRYPTAEHMSRDLESFLADSGQSWSARSIRDYVAPLFERGQDLTSSQVEAYQDVVDDPFAPEDLEQALAHYQAAKSPWAALHPEAAVASKPRRAMTLGSIAALVPDEPEPPSSSAYAQAAAQYREAASQAPAAVPTPISAQGSSVTGSWPPKKSGMPVGLIVGAFLVVVIGLAVAMM